MEKIFLTFLCNIPLPPLGSVKIEYKLNEEYKKIILKRPKMNELTMIRKEINLIFKKFDIKTFLGIFKHLIFETKILIFSSKINELSYFIYGLTSLLFPFHYSFQISFLIPHNAFTAIESNSPYLFGINQIYKILFLENIKLIRVI